MSKGSGRRPEQKAGSFAAGHDRIFGMKSPLRKAPWWIPCPGCGSRHISYNPLDELATCLNCTNMFNEEDVT